jgi:hypothetical protein
MQSAGVTQSDAEFIPNIGDDWYEVGVSIESAKTVWFNNWQEAREFVMSEFPEKNWEESGWH